MENDQSDLIARQLLEIERLKRELKAEREKNVELREKVREILTDGKG